MTLGLTLLAPLAGMTQVSAESHNSAVYINVSVRNNGRLLPPLKAENVRLKIGNRIVPVNRIEKDKAMRRIAIVLDSSGSMQFVRAEWLAASSIAAAIAATAPISTELSFVSFGSDDKKAFLADKEHREFVEQIAALRGVKPSIHSHRTDLWDSIAKATQNPLPLHSGDVVFVITDGGDTGSHISVNELEKKLCKAGIRVFGFALQATAPRTEEEREGLNRLYELVRQTGGDSFTMGSLSPKDRQEVQDTIVQFLTEAVQPYRVEISAEAAPISGKLMVEIVDSGIDKKDLLILAPATVFP